MMVSIIIVNYNTKDLILKCISSIIEHTKNIEYEIVVVDNSSSDDSPSFIKKSYPKVILVESDVNLGFGKANNLGVGYSSGEFVFLLNSDTVLIENSVKKMYDFFVKNEEDLKIGVLGGILVDENLIVNGYGSHFPNLKEEIGKIFKRVPVLKYLCTLQKAFNYNLSNVYFKIDYVIGADMFLRKSIFEQVNGFDEDFFMYYEESDIQKRINKIGFFSYIFTGTRIIHLEEGSGKVVPRYSNRKRTIIHTSRNIYFKKNHHNAYLKFKVFDKILLYMNFLNSKYTRSENKAYIDQVKQTY